MPRIYVEFARLQQIGSDCKSVSSRVDSIQADFQRTIRQLDWDVKYEDNINSTAKKLTQKLENYSKTLDAYQRFIEDTHSAYTKLDEYSRFAQADHVSPRIDFSPDPPPSFDWGAFFDGAITFGTGYVIPTIMNVVLPGTGLLYITSGLPVGKVPSVLDHSRTPSSGASADWLGYELADDHPGITAHIGKAEAHVQNEAAYAGVTGYLGKAEASADGDFSFAKTTTKKEFKNGEWVEKEVFTVVNASVAADATASLLAGEAEAGVGSDMLGVEGSASGSVGTATAKGEAKFSVGEDGVNAYAGGKAMVSAVEGKAEGTINILGLEITGSVGGYAGAAGVEGKIGFENGKFVMEGGVAAVIGGSAGIEIGFNDEGWDNFIDFVTFWD